MKTQETAESYNHLALHWNGEFFNHRDGIEQHQRALKFCKSKNVAIDIGCGSSGRFIDLLIKEGFETEGLDISPEMIRLAKIRHPGLIFHLADICDWEFTRQYDFITAWDSIWHAPLNRHAEILQKLCSGLKNDGVLIFTCGGLDYPDERTNPCRGQPLYHATLGLPEIVKLLLDFGCSCRHLEFDQLPHPHVCLIIQKVSLLSE